jgi:uncharacterized protein (TIGR02453 family)
LDFQEFISSVLLDLSILDTRFASMNASKCIFRINRDIRFSKNKDPYKTNFGMNLNLSGSKEFFCGFYLHLEPGNSFFAGGTYLPPSDVLNAIRQEIDYHSQEFSKIVLAKKFVSEFGGITGDRLTRPPKGYDANNEMIEFIKMKSFIAERKLTDEELSSIDLKKFIVDNSKLILPLNDFLLRSVAK